MITRVILPCDGLCGDDQDLLKLESEIKITTSFSLVFDYGNFRKRMFNYLTLKCIYSDIVAFEENKPIWNYCERKQKRTQMGIT